MPPAEDYSIDGVIERERKFQPSLIVPDTNNKKNKPQRTPRARRNTFKDKEKGRIFE